jgi:hypothetical protein
MLLQQEIRISDQGSRGYARATGCSLNIEQTLFGYRLRFNFSFEAQNGNSVSLDGWELDLYLNQGSQSILVGRLVPDLSEHPKRLMHQFTLQRHLDLRSDDFVRLVDKSYRGDVVFEFRTRPLLSGIPHEGNTEQGRLTIPQSEWLELCNRTGMDRFELIAIRVPVRSSHLHQPFSDAVSKIREAERQYSRGDWNAAGSSCRSAWRTILSTAPAGTQAIENLLAPVIGDSRRKDFGLALAKGLNTIANQAVHLEGDVKTGMPPANLTPEDALLCIHWYAAVIGYLSSL